MIHIAKHTVATIIKDKRKKKRLTTHTTQSCWNTQPPAGCWLFMATIQNWGPKHIFITATAGGVRYWKIREFIVIERPKSILSRRYSLRGDECTCARSMTRSDWWNQGPFASGLAGRTNRETWFTKRAHTEPLNKLPLEAWSDTNDTQQPFPVILFLSADIHCHSTVEESSLFKWLTGIGCREDRFECVVAKPFLYFQHSVHFIFPNSQELRKACIYKCKTTLTAISRLL